MENVLILRPMKFIFSGSERLILLRETSGGTYNKKYNDINYFLNYVLRLFCNNLVWKTSASLRKDDVNRSNNRIGWMKKNNRAARVARVARAART